jgi:hypothetical protein
VCTYVLSNNATLSTPGIDACRRRAAAAASLEYAKPRVGVGELRNGRFFWSHAHTNKQVTCV